MQSSTDYTSDHSWTSSDPSQPGYGPAEPCIRHNPGCTLGMSTSSGTLELRLASPSTVSRILFGTGGGHDTGARFSYKVTSSDTSWTAFTGIIANDGGANWGDFTAATFGKETVTMSDIRYECLGGNWCKIGYVTILGPECVACDANANSPAGSDGGDDCLCNAGYTGSLSGTTSLIGSCTACPEGQFKGSSGSASCQTCISGAFSNPWRTACVA
jgi:hypothetical protein